MIISLPIDQKSLYFNIKNDNKTGHTATVATPLKQGQSLHEELARIYDVPENICHSSRESLITKIVSGSRAVVRIPNVFCFENISVNGQKVETKDTFCIYIREEIDPNNVHFGRLKVHYPPSLIFEDEHISINNKAVMKAISDTLNNYAFIIENFEYDCDSNVLNFNAVIIGPNNTPYSKVFVNKKGVGNKFSPVFNEYADTYDAEIIALRDKLGYENVTPDNFMDIQIENKQKSIKLLFEALNSKGCKNIKCINDSYPYSLYDIEYIEDGIKKFIIVNTTSTKIPYFNMSYQKIRFMNDFIGKVDVALITDVLGSPVIHWYDIQSLDNMSKSINSITYEDR